MAIFKRQYRVMEKVMGDGRSRFYPQTRRFLFWNNMQKPDQWQESIERAKKSLMTQAKEGRAESEVKAKTHQFDEVFEQLKQQDKKTSNW